MAQKRRSNGWEPPTKRLHSRNDFDRREYQYDYQQQANLPPLPPISPEYEIAVFTHQSQIQTKDGGENFKSYERLEFLGDAYIELMASRLIFETHKTLPTGRMSQIRELLVKNETLAEYSTLYGFDKKLRINQDFSRGKPKVWMKIRGDMFEAYVAAIVLSDPTNGFDLAEKWLTELWKPKLTGVKPVDPSKSLEKQRLAQAIKAPHIQINYVDEKPPVQHKGVGQLTHFVGVYLTGWGWQNQHLGSGKGLNKTEAGNEAASMALKNYPLIDQIAAERDKYVAEKEAEKERTMARETDDA